MNFGIDANNDFYFKHAEFISCNILKNPDMFRVLLFLLSKTRYETLEFYYKEKIMTLNSGQVFIRDKEISHELKIEPKKVEALLRGLKKRGIITNKKLPTGMIITFSHWHKFNTNGEIQNG